MPRSRKKQGHIETWTAYPPKIKAELLDALCESINLDELRDDDPSGVVARKNELEEKTSWVLGSYEGLVNALDNAPRPANIKAASEPLKNNSFQLAEALIALDGPTKRAIEQRGCDIDLLVRGLYTLIDAAGQVIRENEGKESRQAKGRPALREVIRLLADVYVDLCYGEKSKEAMFEFLSLALEAGDIEHPEDLSPYVDQNLMAWNE